MRARTSENPKSHARHTNVLENAMDAASTAMKDAGKACAAAGLGRKARCSLAEGAMHEAGKLADEAVKIAIAQVGEAMDQMPHHRRRDR